MHSLPTRAAADRYRRRQLLTPPPPQPAPAVAYIEGQARRFTLWLLLAIAGLVLAGSFWPCPPHPLSLEPSPSINIHQPAPSGLATMSPDNE